MPFGGAPRTRRVRPSRARGLRVSTGCLTCRARRIKCDETRPKCRKCAKSSRDCSYAGSPAPNDAVTISHSPASTAHTQLEHEINSGTLDSISVSGTCPISTGGDHASIEAAAIDVDQALRPGPIPIDPILSHITSPQTHSYILNASPFEWFDLLAQDAISNIQRHNLSNVAPRWNFDETSLSRRQSPSRDGDEADTPSATFAAGVDGSFIPGADCGNAVGHRGKNSSAGSAIWNTTTPIAIQGDDLAYFQHYIQVVGPMLDLFDPSRHFTDMVPHLALHNVGVLKSILAVAARHWPLADRRPGTNHLSPGSSLGGSEAPSNSGDIATQYYYETLQYLSKTLSYHSYADSHEILATAILISTYEMLGSDNDGESVDGMRRAVWWAWLRQDMWAAFRAGRPTLTFWRPKKSLEDLGPDEYATRIVYIAAKVVQFAGMETATSAESIQQRIDHGNRLLKDLQSWDNLLPASFRPIVSASEGDGRGASAHTEPIWIHPPSHAGAVQTYHFAMIALLIHMPSIGGVDAYRVRQRQLDDSFRIICGIASHEVHQGPLAFVNIQALYAAGLCVQTPAKKTALLEILQRTMDASKFPAMDVIGKLNRYWETTSY
ncbi:hypothetical protein G7Z17_g2293 [Cylindrodendrum hubeiense]|uniref:Zn(2)-C6 fungal-type domain-containing protein n=1 Tax=Cylindrodendrum hubeiense TaxID=595255 RepID=A0A9P5HI13_9HYPO|nr:hypothetical protein G7Z17_g2293 [Cylindrodendrum hubeiense]